MDLNQFVKWQSEKPTRSVKIEIKNPITVWVWDDALLVGQFVKSVDEIDLEGKRQERDRELQDKERKEYESLRRKFEGVQA